MYLNAIAFACLDILFRLTVTLDVFKWTRGRTRKVKF